MDKDSFKIRKAIVDEYMQKVRSELKSHIIWVMEEKIKDFK